MGDLLFFVYTSTPHRHLQNNFKNEKKTMGIFPACFYKAKKEVALHDSL